MTVTNSTPIIPAVCVGNPKPNNMLNIAYNPIIKNGIPNMKEPNAKFSDITFPP